MRFVSCLIILVTATSSSADPCFDSSIEPIKNGEDRLVSNTLDYTTEEAISDRTLPETWYRSSVGHIARDPPDLLSCGTRYPIWMRGEMPSVTEREATRTACVRHIESDCDYELEIKVKNCDGFYVYYLVPTVGADEAYCFERPSFVPTTLEVQVHLVDHYHEVLQYSEAQCLFEEGDENYFYFISWYVDGDFVQTSPALRYSDRAKGYLQMSKNIIQSLGRKIKCSVFVRQTVDGADGPVTESPEIFVGIEVLTHVVVIKRGDVGYISVRPTLGFGCFPRDSVCQLPLILSALPGCNDVNVVQNGHCWVDMVSTEWDNIYNITVQAKEGGKHDFTATFEVALQTSYYPTHRIWSSYRTETIKVEVLESENKEGLIGTYCEARDDPHMRTFDQRPYEIQYEGDFLMFIHDAYSIQIQIKVRPCRSRGRPYCVCAVAIQAGTDVFVVDRCVSSSKKRTDFAACGDNVLDVRRTSSRRYTVYLPTGTRVQVDLRTQTLTVQIYPSIRDWQTTRGLCGVLSKNCPDDFLMSNGQLFEDTNTNKACDVLGRYDVRFHPNTFSNSWTLEQSNSVNLFEVDGVDDRLTPWSVYDLLCQCTMPDPEDADQTPVVDCKSSMVTECGRAGNPVVTADYCKIKESTKIKRSYKAFNSNKESRRGKRSTQLDPKETDHVEMTLEEAIEYCSKKLFDVPSFKLCDAVPNVNTNHTVELCALDILISNSTEWVDASVESLKMRCLEELNLNETLHEEDAHGISIAKTIQNSACPEECSGAGVCSNGVCICPPGFGASDCSIVLSSPPYFDSILDDGLCDTREWSCDVAVITGDDFVESGKPSCKLRPFYMTSNNVIREDTEVVVDARVQTLMSLLCPLPALPSELELNDVIVKGYTISLSNDGQNFGDGQRIHIFDSRCQNPVEVNGEQGFELKEGFCFIENTCVGAGSYNPEDECQICLPSLHGFKWMSRQDDCAISQGQLVHEPNNKHWIIGAVLGTVAVVAVVVTGVVLKLYCYRAKD